MTAFRVNVQIDPLPDRIVDTVLTRSVGVRLSVAVEPIGGSRATADDLKALLPWQWLDATSGTAWRPASPSVWQVWSITPPNVAGATQTATQIWPPPPAPLGPPAPPPLATYGPKTRPDAVPPPSAPSLPETPHAPATFPDWCTRAVRQLLTPFDPTRLEWRAVAGTPGSLPGGPSVCGFVENLTTLPAPIPEALNVFAVFDLPPGVEQVLIAPVFAVPRNGGNSACTVAVGATPSWSPPDDAWVLTYALNTTDSARALVRSAISLASARARILQDTAFLVAGAQGTDWADATSEDWMTPLPRRLAALLDPLRGFSEALEQVISDQLRAGGGAPPTQDEITQLRQMLAATAWRLLSRSATATTAMTLLSPAVLRDRLAPDGQAGPLLQALAAWSLRDAGAGPADTLPGFVLLDPRNPAVDAISVWSDSRFATLFAATSPDTDQTARQISTPGGLRAWLMGHWARQPPAINLTAAEPLDILRTTGVHWSGGTRARDDRAHYGLLDLRPFAAATSGGSFDLILELTVPATASSLSFRLRAEDSLVSPPDLAVVTALVAAGAASQTVFAKLTFAYPASAPVTAATFAVQIGSQPAVSQAVDPAWRNSRAFVTLEMAGAGNGTVTAAPAGQPVIEGLLSNLSETVLRENAALLFAAPALPLILAGQDLTGTGLPPPAAGSDTPIAAMRTSFGVFATKLFGDECVAAILLSPAADAAMQALFTLGRDRAIANTIARADALFDAMAPSADAAAYAITPKAAPVVVPIDQPQPFADTEDLWSKFAGAGVLVASSPALVNWALAPGSTPEPPTWYSLNAAEVHVLAGTTDGQISYDDATTIVVPTGAANAVTYFDPVPAQIAEMGGVRAACITYENRGLVGVMPHDPGHDQGDPPTAAAPRRVEAYGFPYGLTDTGGRPTEAVSPSGHHPIRYRTGAKLPALSFGKNFHFLPYLIGHGGTLPNCLWDSGNNAASPTQVARNADASVKLNMIQLQADAVVLGKTRADLIRTLQYLRTTPVGPPRLSLPLVPPAPGKIAAPNTVALVPAVPDGVAPLAAELAVTPSPISLLAGEQVFFYADSARAEGLLNFATQDAGARALRIYIAPLPLPLVGAVVAASVNLIVSVCGRSTAASAAGAAPVGVGILWKSDPIPFTPSVGAVVMLAATLASLPAPPTGPLYVPGVAPTIGTWRDLYVTISIAALPTPAPTTPPSPALTFIPPVVGLGVIDAASAKFNYFADVAAAEFGQQKRKIVVLDGIDGATKLTEKALTIRPPSTDFATYERWINWDSAAAGPALDIAHGLVTTTAPAGTDLSLPDPAVADIAIEVVCLFPPNRAGSFGVRLLGAHWQPLSIATQSPVKFRIATGAVAAEGFVARDGVATGFTVVKGSIYEVRIHGAVPCAAQAGIAMSPDQRFGFGAWQGLRQIGDRPNQYRLGAPLIVTVEVATADMPVFYDADAFQLLRAAGDATGGDTATLRLRSGFVSGANATKLRYVDRIALLSQQWSWRGHALPAPPDALSVLANPPPNASRLATVSGPVSGVAGSFEAKAFNDRRIDDIGVIEETRPSLDQLEKPDTAAPLLVKNLHYSGGAHWDRFALRATSRYAAMRPDRAALVQFSHQQTGSDTPRWQSLLVTDRDTGRAIKRPTLLFVLPLTESLMAYSAVPPLLAIFNESMFAGGNIADGLEATIAYARQPLFVLPRQDPLANQILIATTDLQKKANDACANPGDATKLAAWRTATLVLAPLAATWVTNSTPLNSSTRDELDDATAFNTVIGAIVAATAPSRDLGLSKLRRFWPQFGPDPILTGRGHSGAPVPVRLDGPLGYTFDTDTEAPNFGRSGFMVTPVSPDSGDAAWGLISLQFRRLEAIETSSNPAAPVTDITGKPSQLRLSEPAGVIAPNPVTAAYAATHTPSGQHDGLVIDFGVLDPPRWSMLRIAQGPRSATPPTGSVTIETKRDGDQLTIALTTDLGTAGNYPVTLSPQRSVRLRLVISQRAAPSAAVAPYAPALDVSVRLLIDDGAATDPQDPQTGAWLTLACLPLLAGVAAFLPSDPIFVMLDDKLTETGSPLPPPQCANAVGVRLSPFTSPIWCQFAQDRSRFTITLAGSSDVKTVSILDLVANATDGAPSLTKDGTAVTSLAWLQTDASAQMVGEIAIVVTGYITDALNQRRERPVAIYRVINSDVRGATAFTTEPMWTAPASAITLPGRVRLMTLMRRTPAAGATAPPQTLASYFDNGAIDPIDLNGTDAFGRIVGISQPIPLPDPTALTL